MIYILPETVILCSAVGKHGCSAVHFIVCKLLQSDLEMVTVLPSLVSGVAPLCCLYRSHDTLASYAVSTIQETVTLLLDNIDLRRGFSRCISGLDARPAAIYNRNIHIVHLQLGKMKDFSFALCFCRTDLCTC